MRLQTKVAAVFISILVLLVAVVTARTLVVSSRQVTPQGPAAISLDREASAARLSRALQFRTIAEEGAGTAGAEELQKLSAWLAETFPQVHRTLIRESLAGGSLLYTWRGDRPDLPALLLLGHLDVVPAPAGTESHWSYPPFDGVIADDFVWGRGALDDKGAVIAMLEAAESLIAAGFKPRQTVMLAFGHDEERGGAEGAKVIAGLLASRGVRVDVLIDEGGIIADGIVPGMNAPVALVGIAEKGYVNVELLSEDETDGKSGHSSMPPPMTHVGRIARAVDRIQAHPFRAQLRGATRQMFEVLAPEMKPAFRTLAANLWLFAPVIEARAESSSSLNATLRTTAAPTLISGGIKNNVIPSAARAVVNFRILPGDSIDGVLTHVREAIGDPSVQVRVSGEASEPSTISDPSAPQFRQLSATIRGIFPDVVVAPYLVVAATDARHYDKLTPRRYRFLPVRFNARDLQRMHGVDERIAIRDHTDSIRFYRTLIERWTVH